MQWICVCTINSKFSSYMNSSDFDTMFETRMSPCHTKFAIELFHNLFESVNGRTIFSWFDAQFLICWKFNVFFLDAIQVYFSKWNRTIEIIDLFSLVFVSFFPISLEIRIQTTTKPLNDSNAKCQAMNTKWVFFTHAHNLLLFEIDELTNCLCSYGNGQTITKILYTLFTVVKHEYFNSTNKTREKNQFTQKRRHDIAECVDASFGHMNCERLTTAVIVWNSLFIVAGLACNASSIFILEMVNRERTNFHLGNVFFLRRWRKMREWAHYDPHSVRSRDSNWCCERRGDRRLEKNEHVRAIDLSDTSPMSGM